MSILNARSILIQGIPEDRNENLKVLVHQVLYDTKINVPWSETDIIYREGYFNKRRTRPIVVTFVRKSTRDNVYRARNNIKDNPRCKEVWINEMIADDQKRQRNELKAIYELAILKGYTARYHIDTIVINGITYDHTTISRLPIDLTLEAAFSRETDDYILFHSEHVYLSNFYRCKIVTMNMEFISVEQAYFYILAKETGNHTKAYLIYKTKDPRKIKRIGATITATPEWLRKADQVMYDLLVIKFNQNPELKKLLLATKEKILIEATMNRYWGAGITITTTDRQKKNGEKLRYPGTNWLGKQLNDVRRELSCLVERQANNTDLPQT